MNGNEARCLGLLGGLGPGATVHYYRGLLAGTDLSMVLNEANAGFPTLDCAGVHMEAVTKKLIA